MRILFLLILLNGLVIASSCKNNKKETEITETKTADTLISTVAADDSSAQYLSAAAAHLLPEWKASFSNFQLDSFHFSQRSFYADKEPEDTSGTKEWLELYGPSLVFSADSSMVIDLFSSGMSLERQGKKLVAIADVDMSVALYNRKTGQKKQIAFFGPSAGIEEAAWISPGLFLLAGTMQNDDGIPQAFILIGDANAQKLSWYESGISRAKSVDYTASGIRKLKIDEWE